ncbi:apolipoprotein N-acyltransferase [Phyllobacterium brassicacearum]|uniref:Apolipoprotein N-acyltransferase n=1 Tax=Phyllobacterium brassicacearum TaxID=314235 RepID=A0A2P7BPB2_9HYPH|nr:apolipoprotein N-acyltransferase [Phyllobacterium brassicacearum]PSH68297.1 apolipoprotein N-acyltransferase [Phyllobacterium brassicacearum]TDQ31852.1 apolipoprotein N-acyltransferase [Phyllobacterium brassicacearum]
MIQRLAGKIILLSGWRRAGLAFLMGALASFALPPYDFFAVCFVSFPVLVWLIDGAVDNAGLGPIRRLLPAAAIGWWFGFGYFVFGLWWIGNALLVDADNFAWAIPFAILGLPAFLAFFYALATMLARLLWSDGLGRVLALAFGFGIAEWLRSFILTGFPWNAIGYAAMPVPVLMQSSVIAGLLAMNALAVIVFAMPALLVDRRDLKTGLILVLLLASAHVGYGVYRLNTAVVEAKGPQVRIVQPSIPQDLKWEANARRGIFDKYLAMTSEATKDGKPKPQVIIWPETSVPYILTKAPEALKSIADVLEDGQVLLAGAIRVEEPGGSGDPLYYNSIFAIDSNGEITGAADKVHLVPFGEYLPLERLLRRFGVNEVVEMPGGFTAATTRRSLPVIDAFNVLPLICYEAIFPAEMSYQGAPSDAIVNVTNDAWYGDTPGPYQHFRQAQLRAVEQGLPLVRAANNGLSGVIDPYGRIIDALALDAVGVVDATLPGKVQLPLGEVARHYQFWVVIGLIVIASLAYFLRRRARVG